VFPTIPKNILIRLNVLKFPMSLKRLYSSYFTSFFTILLFSTIFHISNADLSTEQITNFLFVNKLSIFVLGYCSRIIPKRPDVISTSIFSNEPQRGWKLHPYARMDAKAAWSTGIVLPPPCAFASRILKKICANNNICYVILHLRSVLFYTFTSDSHPSPPQFEKLRLHAQPKD
jgi:hypothetical protein